ncbi:MAG: hypothetical protein HY392_02165 [Candidatus Diapherotrites archaeon]|nr:hypothetical protein [Candidatus Diapherotrites archaeon]
MDESAFFEKLSDLGKAEKEKQKALLQAQSHAADILKEAHLKAQKIAEKAEEDSVKIQDEELAKAREEAAVEEKKILKKAQSDAEKIRESRIQRETAKKLAQKVLEG